MSLTRLKWWVLGFAAAVLGIILTLLRGRRTVPRDSDGPASVPRLPESPLREAAERAYEEAILREAEARAKTAATTREIESIAQEDDGAERRKRLAELAKRL